jgi:hypothetical protein
VADATAVWPEKYADGCLNCTRKDIKYSGSRGLCATCAGIAKHPEKMARRRAKYKKPEPVEATPVHVRETTDAELQAQTEAAARLLDNWASNGDGPFESTTKDTVLTINEAETPLASVEQRPGGEPVSSFSPDEPVTSRPVAPTRELPPDESAVEKLGRALGFKRRVPRPPKDYVEPKPRPDAPKGPDAPARKRKSMAEDAERIFTGLGARLTRTNVEGHYLGRHAGLGHYLAWNGPATGEVLEENLADTWPDRKLIQPAIAMEEKWEAIAGVVGPPLIILAIETNPKLIQPLYYPLYLALESSLDVLAPARKKAAVRKEKREATIRENFGDLPPGVDPVRAMIQDMFPWAKWSDDDEAPVYPEGDPAETQPTTEGATP